MTSNTTPTTSSDDQHSQNSVKTMPIPMVNEKMDIEHIPVADDPRKWSNVHKNVVLFLVSSGSMIAGFCANIQNPSVKQIQEELPATSSEFSLSISIFILVQGCVPLFWASVSEIKGRKQVYLTSLTIFTVGSVLAAVSKNIGMFIGFRCLQAAGSSAVMTLGAATLADVFDTHERATKMGIYYIAPLLGPSISPIIGGGLTTAFNWRAAFWFLVIVGGAILLGFLVFFKDTFRRERSITYQTAIKARLRVQARALAKKAAAHPHDTEKQTPMSLDANTVKEAMITMRLSLRDLSPLRPILLVLRRINNMMILTASGLIFAFNFVIVYSTSRMLAAYYDYNSLTIGLVLLAYGIGTIFGSVLGGRWSDRELARLKAANNGVGLPEMRLKSVYYGLWILPPTVIAFGWVSNQHHLHISALCCLLFASGFVSIFVYTSTLAYLVDSNAGRSSIAVSINSSFRGTSAFIATEVVVPIQDGLGDGWMYTIFGALMALCSLLIFLTGRYGEHWRQLAADREARDELAQAQADSAATSVAATPSGPRSVSPHP